MEHPPPSYPAHMTWRGIPVLILNNQIYYWHASGAGGHWAAIGHDHIYFHAFQADMKHGNFDGLSRKEFVRRHPAASLQLDNPKPRPGDTAELFDKMMKWATKGRWPVIRKDYWGIPDLRQGLPKLPGYKEVPTPAPLKRERGDRSDYLTIAGMIAEASAARRRLKGLRRGAWVMSPKTGFRWANWHRGECHWVPESIALPEALQIKANAIAE